MLLASKPAMKAGFLLASGRDSLCGAFASHSNVLCSSASRRNCFFCRKTVGQLRKQSALVEKFLTSTLWASLVFCDFSPLSSFEKSVGVCCLLCECLLFCWDKASAACSSEAMALALPY